MPHCPVQKKRWVGLGVIADNLHHLGTVLVSCLRNVFTYKGGGIIL